MSKKKYILKRLTLARKEILDLIEPLPEKKWHKKFLGKWTLFDFVAHLIGWDTWGAKATREILKGELPAYYKYFDHNWVKFNDFLVKKYRKPTKNSSLRAVRSSHQRLINQIGKIPERKITHDFGLRFWHDPITIKSDTLYQANDELDHSRQLARWLKTGKSQ